MQFELFEGLRYPQRINPNVKDVSLQEQEWSKGFSRWCDSGGGRELCARPGIPHTYSGPCSDSEGLRALAVWRRSLSVDQALAAASGVGGSQTLISQSCLVMFSVCASLGKRRCSCLATRRTSQAGMAAGVQVQKKGTRAGMCDNSGWMCPTVEAWCRVGEGNTGSRSDPSVDGGVGLHWLAEPL